MKTGIKEWDKLNRLKTILNLHLLEWQKKEIFDLLEETINELSSEAYESGVYAGQISGFYEGREEIP